MKHGQSRSRTYRCWLNMLQRCGDPNTGNYSKYGGRGIKVCARWQKFIWFFEDMGHPPTSRHTLDRIESSKGYSKKNCRWADPVEQSNNRPGYNRPITVNGETLNARQWADRTGIPAATIRTRISRGWAPERALSKGRR